MYSPNGEMEGKNNKDGERKTRDRKKCGGEVKESLEEKKPTRTGEATINRDTGRYWTMRRGLQKLRKNSQYNRRTVCVRILSRLQHLFVLGQKLRTLVYSYYTNSSCFMIELGLFS